MEGYVHKHNSRLNLLNSYVYAQPFIHCLYFIYAHTFYVHMPVQITLQCNNLPLPLSEMTSSHSATASSLTN